ncbi:MAG: hypothetical protein R3E91_04790 [Chlamydiales bacterium]
MSGISDCFGFYPKDAFFSSSHWNRSISEVKEDDKKVLEKWCRGRLVFGYVPIFSVISGITRISSMSFYQKAPLGFRVVNVIRGVLEILQLGLLFLIPDLIVTFARYLSHKEDGEGLGQFESKIEQYRYLRS